MPGRSLGVVEVLERVLPTAVRELFTLITQLGDAWFLLAAVALVYWYADRRRGTFALAAVLGALSLTLALKGLFALPRPPASFRVGHAGGYGFPSGHAIGATVVWGLLALIVEHGSRHRRVLVASAAVALVSISRVVIGVHYVVDVVVGVAVGLAFLAALVRATDWNPGRAFAVAAILAFVALATYGVTPNSVASVGGVLGAGATWAALDEVPDRHPDAPAAFVGLAVLAALGYAGNALDVPLFAVFVLNGAIPVGILVLPLAAGRVRKAESVSAT